MRLALKVSAWGFPLRCKYLTWRSGLGASVGSNGKDKKHLLCRLLAFLQPPMLTMVVLTTERTRWKTHKNKNGFNIKFIYKLIYNIIISIITSSLSERVN